MAASAVPASSPVIRCTSAWPGHDAACQPQLGGDRAGSPPRPTPPTTGPSAPRAGFDPLHGAGHRADRLGQQTRIGRIRTSAATAVVSARTLSVRSSFAAAALAGLRSASFNRASASSPHRVVIFINVVGCGTGSGKTVARKGNRRPPGTTTHGPTGAGTSETQPQIGLHRDRRAADPGIEIRGEPREKHRIIQRRRPNSDRQHQQLGRHNSPRVTTKFDRGRFGCD